MDRSFLVGGRQITIGASTTIGVTASSFWQGCIVKKANFDQVGITFNVSLVDGITYSWTQGYEIGDGEVIRISGPATFFLAAAGNTAIVSLAAAYSSSATNIPNPPPVGGLL